MNAAFSAFSRSHSLSYGEKESAFAEDGSDKSAVTEEDATA